MESDTFTYHALDLHTDEIRLISLEPCDLSQPESQVACTLITAKLSENPKYEALSYMWGSLSNPTTITVDFQDFSVGENLWRALRQLRLGASRRTIWIDAICINQADTTERNHQVSQMSKIYSCAEQVLVWLGPDTSFSDQAMRFLGDLAGRTIPSMYCDKTVFKDHWKAVERFCDLEYWGRLWIIQEVVLAAKAVLIWGAAVLPFTAFQTVCENTQSLDKIRCWNFNFIRQLPKTLPGLLSLRRNETRAQKGTGATLLDLMATFRGATCKDEKDKIFGLLSLSQSCCRGSMAVEYSRSVYDLYNRAFSHYVECHFDLKSSGVNKSSIFSLRNQLHAASKKRLRGLIDGSPTIMYTGLLESISCNDSPTIWGYQTPNAATTWLLPYTTIPFCTRGVSVTDLEKEGKIIVELFRRLPMAPDSKWDLKTTIVKVFLAKDGMVGFVPENVMPGDQFFRSSDGVSLTIKRLHSSGSWTVVATAQLNGDWINGHWYPEGTEPYFKFRL